MKDSSQHPRRLGIVMDPIEGITAYKDTSLALMLAFQARGYRVFYMQAADLEVDRGSAIAHGQWLKLMDNNNHWFEREEAETLALGSLDLILMRLDPPVHDTYHTALQILDLAEKQGACVLNRPASIQRFNEKVFATHFADLNAESLISQRSDSLRRFVRLWEFTILKPLDGMGGTGIFKVSAKDPNLSVIIEQLTDNGSRKIMAQRYMPEIKEGDKRILLVNGEAVPYALARLPAKGEVRGNIAAGGSGRPQALSPSDWEIARELGPKLRELGLLFVGLDVIGDKITEINVTSPTCAREIDAAFQTNIGDLLVDAFEALPIARA